MSQQQGTTADDYSKRYYAHYSDTAEPYDWTSPGWRGWFEMVAKRVHAATGEPASSLDVGCAKGLLVQAFAELGVDAAGFDLSPSSIGDAHPDVRDRVRVASATDPIEGHYDLVTCIEVLEHMAPADAETAIDNICAVTDRVVISSTPGDFDEPTHVNVHPLADWVAAFAIRGFYRRTDVDLGFLTPWAVYFERARLTPRDIVHRYEGLMYPMRLELNEKREQLLAAHRELGRIDDAEFEALRHENLRLRDAARGAEAEVGVARGEVAMVNTKLAEARAEVAAIRGSERWRLGGALLAPASALRRRMKG